jgi:hypothetical protein
MTVRRLAARWWWLRAWLRRVPPRVRLGAAAAVVAMAGLLWQYSSHHGAADHSAPSAAAPSTATMVAPRPGGATEWGDDPDVGQIAAPTVAPELASIEAAREVAQRFAANFASPNGDRDSWLARIDGDVSAQLMEQYRLTDIRNLTQATVASLQGPVSARDGAAAFRATYSDESHIEIRLELSAEGWKVVNVLPLPAAAGTEPPGPGGR